MTSDEQNERGVDRRSILRGAATGAAVGLLPLFGASTQAGATGARSAPGKARGTSANAVAAASCGPLPLTGGNEFPIGLFWPPPPFQTTLDHYSAIRQAGFTFVITGNYLGDSAILKRVCQVAEQVDLKVLVSSDPDVDNLARRFTISDDRSVPLSISTADARTLAGRALGSYRDFDSFAGFGLYDEPGQGAFPSLANAYNVIREVAPRSLPYSNLFPGNGSGYRDYVRAYVDTVKPSVLSFDRYPILASGQDTNYFDNWAIIRSEGLRAGIPTWTYIQSVQYAGHKFPNEAEVRWQTAISLAHGCKGIQYFTYWQPDPARGEAFGPAIVDLDGKHTALYDAAKNVNTGWLQPVGRQLKSLTSELVQHANESPLPPGTVGFTPDAYLTAASGSAVVLGRFTPGSGPTRYLLVANRSYAQSANTTLTVNRTTVEQVSRFDPATGRYVPQANSNTIAASLSAGAANLYRLEA